MRDSPSTYAKDRFTFPQYRSLMPSGPFNTTPVSWEVIPSRSRCSRAVMCLVSLAISCVTEVRCGTVKYILGVRVEYGLQPVTAFRICEGSFWKQSDCCNAFLPGCWTQVQGSRVKKMLFQALQNMKYRRLVWNKRFGAKLAGVTLCSAAVNHTNLSQALQSQSCDSRLWLQELFVRIESAV